MGVVYSGIEFNNRAIPYEGAHAEAASMVLDRVSELPWVTSTLVHGSVIDGTSNRRSDLDVLAVYDYDELHKVPDATRILKQKFEEISKKTHVKIEPNIWPRVEPVGARKQRMYDMLFSWHLRDAMLEGSGLVGDVDVLTMQVAAMLPARDIEAIRDVAMNYTVYKQGGFTAASSDYVDGDPRALGAMQRGLELPKAIGRKVAQLVAACEGREVAGNDFTFDKELLDSTTGGALAKLEMINADYTRYLEVVLEESPGDHIVTQRYVQWLDNAYNDVISNGIIATVGLSHFIHDYRSKV